MTKSVHNDVLDAALQYVEDNGSRLCVCNAAPTTYLLAINQPDAGSPGYKLADVDIISTDYTGPADGDASGRKTTVNQQAGVSVDYSGTANHLAIVDVSNTKLLYVTEVNSQAVTAGNTLTIPAFDIEIADPT